MFDLMTDQIKSRFEALQRKYYGSFSIGHNDFHIMNFLSFCRDSRKIVIENHHKKLNIKINYYVIILQRVIQK